MGYPNVKKTLPASVRLLLTPADLSTRVPGPSKCLCDMFKRARRLGEPVDDCVNDAQRSAGEQLRQHILDKWATEGLSGCDVCIRSYHITQAGAVGVADLALKPESASKHGHEHVRLHAGKIYPDPDLHYVDTPMFIKRDARRSIDKVPILLPSVALKENMTPEVASATESSNKALLKNLQCYESHPVVQRARQDNPQAFVRPLALYWDGVQYTINDSLLGFYVTDVLSEQKFLSFLLRRALICFKPSTKTRDILKIRVATKVKMRCANAGAGMVLFVPLIARLGLRFGAPSIARGPALCSARCHGGLARVSSSVWPAVLGAQRTPLPSLPCEPGGYDWQTLGKRNHFRLNAV